MLDSLLVWQKAQDHLRNRLGETAFDTWISPLKANPDNKQGILLEAPDIFFKDWVEKHYKQLIQEAIDLASPKQELKVRLESAEGTLSALPTAGGPALRPAEQLSSPTNLNPRYTFENFVVGPSNRHAHAYSLAVAESPAKAYNPLFIYGGVGLGKTHLMQAICHSIKSRAKELKICYMSSEKFTNELIDAIQHHSTANFRQKYRNMDVLVIDDIHFIAGKESTQEEFFHTFNHLYSANKQIVISSDRHPRAIPTLEDRVRSRFEGGMITDIQPPDFEMRIAILRTKADAMAVRVPDEVVDFIARKVQSNIREL